tara:strand:- start:7310 stop:7573 length:264 start_codon:yes stop_codon:yes gene_type:complete
MDRRERIISLLEKQFSDSFIEISDDSHLHADHNPSAKSGGTHFTIKIVSKVFKGKSRIEKHRMVNNILDSEFKNGLHALSLTLSDKE